jgi:membrane-bound lytic murein transglycosylase D
MLNKCFPLIAVLTLCSCARQSADLAEAAAAKSEPSVVSNHQQSAVLDVPMSPLDPVIAQSELSAYTDVWQRIRQQMHIQVPPRADIRREIAFFASKQKFFNEVATRAEPYLYLIVTELEKRRMPVELALLPIVESAYNPAAQGKGPAGLWQMVPQTARNFGLKIQHGYDGRKDPMSSTIAVLDYLQHLHDNLGNDWLNAVAAYNTGEGRIMAAVERNKARGKPTDYWSLQIPGRYVQTMPKWLAMISLVKNPANYQISLPPVPNRAVVGSTSIAGAVQLQQAADLAGIPLNQLRKLNPGFGLTTTPEGKEFPLLLPLETLDAFEKQRHLLKKVAVTAIRQGEPQRYKVKSGDTLGSIAARHKTKVASLRRLNQLKNDQLQTGQILLLPTGGTTAASTAVASRSEQNYQVKAGDSLWTIAQKLRIDSEELRIYNKLAANTHLKPGQTLRVPGTSVSPVKAAGNTRKTKSVYTVKQGDSLDRIAKKHKIKLADLLKWNKLQADSRLKPGQQLRLTPVKRQS